MPKFFVVTDQADTATLVSALVGNRIGAAKRDAVLAELRLANPQLDLDRLEPGLVIRVPDLPDVTLRAFDPLDASLDDLLDRSQESLKSLLEATEAGEVARRQAADMTRQVITSPEVRRAAGRLPELKANLASVEKRLALDDEEFGRTDAILRAAADSWLGDLKQLRGLRG